MKIYNRVVIDLETLEVLEEDSFKYHGPIAECKGGGGGTTTSVDTAYNARMATIAESQQAMADEYFEFWQDEYKPFESAQIEANMEMLPNLTALQQEQIASDRGIIPAQTELKEKSLGLGIQNVESLKPVASEFYKQALSGVDVRGRVNQASADVAKGLADSDAAVVRKARRMGVNPGSGAGLANLGASSLDKARAIGGARTGARDAANAENFSRLNTAMNKGLGVPS